MIVDRTPAIAVDAMVFRREEWPLRTTFRGSEIAGVSGTWSPRHANMADFVLALVCCPKCQKPSILHSRVHKISSLGKVSPSFICKYMDGNISCDFHRNVFLDEWSKRKPLYACSVMRNGKIEISYCHANTVLEATVELGLQSDRGARVIAVGRAIGFFVNDKIGNDLSVD